MTSLVVILATRVQQRVLEEFMRSTHLLVICGIDCLFVDWYLLISISQQT